jgi:hypothetical protein
VAQLPDCEVAVTIWHIGRHAVQHGDIMDGIDNLMKGERASLFWCDPPWGNLRFWQTLNNKQTGAPANPATDAHLFLATLFGIAVQHTDGAVIIPYGVKWRQQVIEAAQKAGLVHLGTGQAVYTSERRPLDIHLFSTVQGLQVPERYWADNAGIGGYDSVFRNVQPFAVEGGILLDPCCGMGFAAQAALDTGMRFRGNELNAARLEKTRARLMTGRG